MKHSTVRLSVPFDSLYNSVRELSADEKYRLWELLEEQIGRREEELMEKDEVIQAQIKEARTAFQKGDYETVDEYIDRREKKFP